MEYFQMFSNAKNISSMCSYHRQLRQTNRANAMTQASAISSTSVKKNINMCIWSESILQKCQVFGKKSNNQKQVTFTVSRAPPPPPPPPHHRSPLCSLLSTKLLPQYICSHLARNIRTQTVKSLLLRVINRSERRREKNISWHWQPSKIHLSSFVKGEPLRSAV